MTQQTLWHKHEPVVAVMKRETIRFCRTCGERL